METELHDPAEDNNSKKPIEIIEGVDLYVKPLIIKFSLGSKTLFKDI